MGFILLGILNAQAAGAAGFDPIPAYDLLETVTLTANTATISFTGLDTYSDYKHLQLRAAVGTIRGNNVDGFAASLNGDTGANYSTHAIQADPPASTSSGSASATSATLGVIRGGGDLDTFFTPVIATFFNFLSTTKNKTIKRFSGFTDADRHFFGSTSYYSTDAITSMSLSGTNAVDLQAGTRVSLYGIKG